jgi:hypothetical protein
MRIVSTALGCLLVLALCGLWPSPGSSAEDAPRITKEEAKALLGSPNVVFIDARTDAAWSASDKKIKGAVRIDKWDLETQASGYGRDSTFIVY